MRITLDTWERSMLAQIVGKGRGTFEQIEMGLEMLKILRLSDGEKQAIGYRQLGPNQLVWNVNQQYELEFDDDIWHLAVMLTRGYQAWPMDERVRPFREKMLGAGS